jgi:hypothetical protein
LDRQAEPALGVRRSQLTWPKRWTPASTRRLAIFVAPFTIAFCVYLGAYVTMRPAATGDEPHYFLIAESIAYDGDIDLTNDYASRSRTEAVCNCFPLDPHAFHYTSSGGLYPWHGIGLPILLVPAVAIGGLTAVRILMILLAALMADQLYRLLAGLRIARSWRLWLAWGAIAFTVPILVFSNQILTEIPGALFMLIGLRAILARPVRTPWLVAGAAAGAFLPWLQTRYLPLSGLIFVGLLVAIGRDRSRSDAAASFWDNLRARPREIVAVVVIYLLSLGVMEAFLRHFYGSFSPETPLRRATHLAEIGAAGWKFWYQWFLAYFFDRGIGWIPYAPVAWLALAGLVCLYKRFRWPALVVTLGAAAYALLVASTGIAPGAGFPARYLVTVIPLAAIPLALVIERVREARTLFIPLLIVSAVIGVAAVLDYQSLYPFAQVRRHEARLFGVRSIQTAFPNTLFIYVANATYDPPGAFQPQTGRLAGGRVIASSSQKNPPGFLLWGPYTPLRQGRYVASFALHAGGPRGREVGRIEIAENGVLLAARSILATPRLGRPGLHPVDLPFTTSGGNPVETRVYFEGSGELETGTSRVLPAPHTQPLPPASFPDWPLAFVWLAGTALIAVLFGRLMDFESATARP